MPLRPDLSYWTDDKLHEFREEHLKIVGSMGATHAEDIERIKRKWYVEDSERSEYRRFLVSKTDSPHRKHTRFQEWVDESESDWRDGAKPIPPPFLVWLELKANTPAERRAAGYFEYVVVTPIGVVTYEFKPGRESRLEKDQRIIELTTAHPNIDLKTYQSALEITITRIDTIEKPKQFGFGVVIGESD